MPSDPDQSTAREALRVFPTTHWTLVLSSGDATSPEAHTALARLCQAYWLPIYAFVRKRGHSPEQAEDLVQDFFAHFLEKQNVSKATRERGRFRSFLMTSVENFMRNAHARKQAAKRGGGIQILSLNVLSPEESYLADPADLTNGHDPSMAFERRWALTLLDQVWKRLGDEFLESGRSELYDALSCHLWSDADSIPFAQIAAQFGLSVANVKTIAHRLRLRYRELLRDEIAQTVSQPAEIDDEIRHLMRVVRQ